MKKRIWIVWLLGLILELAVLLFISKSYTAITWITTIFTVLAFGTHGYVWSRGRLDNPKQAFFSYPGVTATTGYIIIQLILCIIFGVFSSTATIKVTVFVNLVPLIIVWALVLTTGMGKAHIQRVDSQQKNHHTEL